MAVETATAIILVAFGFFLLEYATRLSEEHAILKLALSVMSFFYWIIPIVYIALIGYGEIANTLIIILIALMFVFLASLIAAEFRKVYKKLKKMK